ncbi:MAG: 16S rRNA (uracil(1498)-N(3))-methyltransferase [Chitinophagaceae bacterium]|nr:16S rRNA (uracil(1498)-N(3))-methyltransferase [Chitinophagaceae bacterium]MBK8310388.1 16S rRNA (uracil(1498)-N(3))-methyltransferase [Chitinophagaceae bacterium]MBK8607918.1 16S rRNA (uracil(1498)-N(3))-methyltransferase [Chitinophagaceae bacterium]MBP6477636.1 16S rRNA (uracil(1498)-N(3))-methyltransferase [Chitinophagaceae bacterium]MBP7107616.1 16S rRNA (uracil(1498)-N(3))-methyltransferase [Chitinophagaceae bacterium]
MTLPFFYIDNYNATQNTIELNEETSKHVVQVLRMKNGEQLNLTDGKGNLLTCEIIDDHKKHCVVQINSKEQIPNSDHKVSIAISLLKNANRFEWFLEKATEIGVAEIIPLICERTEKEKFRYDRMQGICISAMLQSQQCWLPMLHEPKQFEDVQIWKCADGSNFIAHCIEDNKLALSNQLIGQSSNQLIAIGPEGDFTSQEIDLALQNDFIPVSLGETRLRTETAGVVAAALLQNSF